MIDKHVGPTSHDVVARVRRVVGERVGHTGTLDPLASGVLPLLVGRATRLARFLSTDDKEYVAVVRLGFSTNTHDALGEPASERYTGVLPARERIDRALDAFRGTFLQQPPAFSAKKIGGRRSYRLARAHARDAQMALSPAALPAQPPAPALPAPVAVTTRVLDIVRLEDELLTLRIVCSGGFYVRSLAHDLGETLGIGAHLAELRRHQSSGFTLADAVSLAAIEQASDPMASVRQALIPLSRMLPGLAEATLTASGVRRAGQGCELAAGDLIRTTHSTTTHDLGDQVDDPSQAAAYLKLLDDSGNLVGVAEIIRAGVLHPVVVLM